MEQNKKPIISATGGIHIGESFLKSFQTSWPFGKIEVYQDKIILKIQYLPSFTLKLFEMISNIPGMMGVYKKIPKKIELSLNDIKSYKEKNAWILGYGITFIHSNEQQAPFLQVWVSKNKAQRIIKHLNTKGVYK